MQQRTVELICDDALYTSEIKGEILDRERLQYSIRRNFGQLTGEAERLAGLRQPAHRTLTLIWRALGDRARAEHHALAAYRWAWADGEPYVNRYELTKTTELLQQMNVPVPVLPPYDPAKDLPFPREADVRAAIEKLRVDKK